MSVPSEFETEQFGKGLQVRRKVLGAAYVDQSVQNVDPFMVPLQKLITEYCWGEVWSRPGLDLRIRSLINLAMISALNRPNELKLHVRGALNNGVTPAEIQEVLLQVAIYCGIPAALDSTKIARDVIREHQPSAAEAAP